MFEYKNVKKTIIFTRNGIGHGDNFKYMQVLFLSFKS